MAAIFVPLFISWGLTCFWYLSAVNRLRRLAAVVSAADQRSNDLKEVRNKLMIIPLCYILTVPSLSSFGCVWRLLLARFGARTNSRSFHLLPAAHFIMCV
jgi:hypothetical protein